MDDKFFTLKTFNLNNHCPECYSREGLELTFKQKFVENTFFKAITTDTIHSLYCTNCNTEIFPVRWTDDVDQVVDYHIRAVTPKPKSLKLKKMSWVIIFALTILVFGAVYFGTELFK